MEIALLVRGPQFLDALISGEINLSRRTRFGTIDPTLQIPLTWLCTVGPPDGALNLQLPVYAQWRKEPALWNVV